MYLVVACTTTPGPATQDRADALIEAQRWQEAAALLDEVTSADPDNGMAWFQLAYALQRMGELDRSIAANARAARLPSVRATALYNTACAHALAGHTESALYALDQALRAGFTDADKVANDPDLISIRDDPRFSVPVQPTRLDLVLDDHLVLEYALLLPPGFDPTRSYPVLLTPSTRLGPFEQSIVQRGWVAVGVDSAHGGPFTAHESDYLPQLFQALEQRFPVEGGRYHLVGSGRGGVAAFHAAIELPDRFHSLTVHPGFPGEGSDGDRLHRLADTQVSLFVGGRDTYWLQQSRWTYALLLELGVDVTLEVFPDDGHALPSLEGGELAQHLEEIRAKR